MSSMFAARERYRGLKFAALWLYGFIIFWLVYIDPSLFILALFAGLVYRYHLRDHTDETQLVDEVERYLDLY